MLTKVTKAWRISAPPGAPFLFPVSLPLSLSSLSGGGFCYLNSFLSFSRSSWVSRMSGGFAWSVLFVLRGAVVNRPEPWTRLRCSESHWSNPVVLPVGQPGAPVSSKSLPAWFVRWRMKIGDSATCPLSG